MTHSADKKHTWNCCLSWYLLSVCVRLPAPGGKREEEGREKLKRWSLITKKKARDGTLRDAGMWYVCGWLVWWELGQICKMRANLPPGGGGRWEKPCIQELTSERTEGLSGGGEKTEFKAGGKGRHKRPIREFRGRAKWGETLKGGPRCWGRFQNHHGPREMVWGGSKGKCWGCSWNKVLKDLLSAKKQRGSQTHHKT